MQVRPNRDVSHTSRRALAILQQLEWPAVLKLLRLQPGFSAYDRFFRVVLRRIRVDCR
jgi:hypothetical protein